MQCHNYHHCQPILGTKATLVKSDSGNNSLKLHYSKSPNERDANLKVKLCVYR